MEQRLQMLKALMAEEKAKRESKRLPGGTNWRSARQDGTGSGARYVENVLKDRPTRAQGPHPPPSRPAVASRADGVAPALKPSSAGRVGRLRAAAAAGSSAPATSSDWPARDPLATELAPAPPQPRPGQRPSAPRAHAAEAIALPVGTGVEPTAPLATGTRDLAELFAWHPNSALPSGDYDVRAGRSRWPLLLLCPAPFRRVGMTCICPSPVPPPPPPPPPAPPPPPPPLPSFRFRICWHRTSRAPHRAPLAPTASPPLSRTAPSQRLRLRRQLAGQRLRPQHLPSLLTRRRARPRSRRRCARGGASLRPRHRRRPRRRPPSARQPTRSGRGRRARRRAQSPCTWLALACAARRRRAWGQARRRAGRWRR